MCSAGQRSQCGKLDEARLRHAWVGRAGFLRTSRILVREEGRGHRLRCSVVVTRVGMGESQAGKRGNSRPTSGARFV